MPQYYVSDQLTISNTQTLIYQDLKTLMSINADNHIAFSNLQDFLDFI